MVQLTGFAPNTFFETPEGKLSVEWLREGDLIDTMDAGPQEIIWIGRGSCRSDTPDDAVVLPDAGGSQLCVAPHQQIMVVGWQLELLFGCDEMLVDARHILPADQHFQPTISGGPDAVHLMLAQPALVKADGIWVSAPGCDRPFIEQFSPAVQKTLEALPVAINDENQAIRPVLEQWEATELNVPLLSLVATASGAQLVAPLEDRVKTSTFGSLAV